MTGPEYEQKMKEIKDALRHFAIVGLVVSDDHLAIMQETVERAESFGHILDPTAYRRAMQTQTLVRQRKLLEIFARTRRDLRKLFHGDAAFWEALQEVHRANEGGTH